MNPSTNPTLTSIIALAIVVGTMLAWTRRFGRKIAEPERDDAGTSGPPPIASPIGRRLTPARHALMLEQIAQIQRDVLSVTDATRDPQAVGDAAMLYLDVLWLLPVCDELLHDHVVIAKALTPDEEAPKKKLNERYRERAAGAFGITKPSGERPT